MAEISDEPPKNNPDLDPDPTRPTKPGTKRLSLTLTVFASFLFALPFLLNSTEIHRSPLPFRPFSSRPPPCRFQAVFLRSRAASGEGTAGDLALAISDQMVTLTAAAAGCGSCAAAAVSVAVDSGEGGCDRSWSGADACLWRCGALAGGEGIVGGGDEKEKVVDEFLEKALEGGRDCDGAVGGRVYTVVVVAAGRGGGKEGFRVVVGKHRHAWIIGNISETEAAKVIAEVFVEVFMRGGGKQNGGGTVEGNGEEFMPVGSDGSVTLSFSLLNANPNDWVYDWDFKNIGEKMLAPIVESLAPLTNVKVESQVLYHTPKSSFSCWDSKLKSHIFSTGDLPFFVNSKEWHLDTSSAAAGRSKVLQFVVYVPSAKECPLLFRLPNKEISMTNGFISPMWGGVIVWNPPTCSMHSHSNHLLKNMISPQDLHQIFQVSVGQLRLLFGLKSDNVYVSQSGGASYLASDRGFTDWELDFLFRRHACFNLVSCSTTLESLSNLVQSLPRMIVMDEIGKQVKLSFEAANLAEKNASLGAYDGSAASSRQARSLAEDAFFHPSIMSITYSSIEHYFAIYMPFFAPVALHVLLATVKELKRYKREKIKFLAYVGCQSNIS